MPGVDQHTAKLDLKEPTATLRTFRSGVYLGSSLPHNKPSWGKEVFFGQNIVCTSGSGTEVRLGASLEVLSWHK